MKILTKIYLSIGLILIIFSVVTLYFIYQSYRTDHEIQRVLLSAEVTRQSEAVQKSLVDMETGLRGYLIAENDRFLEPYYSGISTSEAQLKTLHQLMDDSTELNLLHQIGIYRHKWIHEFSEPVIAAKMAAIKNHQLASRYDSIYDAAIKIGRGKMLMDEVRQRFDRFDAMEIKVKNEQVAILERAIFLSRIISVLLTLAAIAIGVATAWLLGRTIHRRLTAMIELSDRISTGDFDVEVQDHEQDEMSSLSRSLNLMAVKLKTYFTNLTKTNRELDQFAYVVSHDLKAPLRAINNLAEWISEDITDKDPEIQRNLTLMRGRAHRMENLINGILEYSKIGRREIKPETFNVKDLLEEIVDMLAPPPNFQISLPEQAPTLTTEKIFLQQVLTNLVSNGIKYNNKTEGHISIEIKEAGKFYVFTVTDNGPGIPEAFHDKIFGIFQTMEARDTRESTGVGLAIVKKIIDEKGGKLKVRSEEDKFTAIIFTWPKEQLNYSFTENPR